MIGSSVLAAALLAASPYPVARVAPGVTSPGTEQRCALPPIDRRSKLMVLGLYEGAFVSPLNVGDDDDETTVADIDVEPGPGRITLVVSSYGAVIYRFRGETGRVSRVILLRQKNVAVEGLSAAKVSFVSAAECDLPYSLYKGPPGLFAPRIQALFDREAISQGGTYSLFRAELGTDQLRVVEEPKPALSGSTHFEQEMARFHPAGIAEVDPRRLVASGPVRRYEVLPSTAGIVQLLKEGAVVEGGREELNKWLETAARRGLYQTKSLADLRDHSSHNLLIVRRPITVPVGLCGAHSVTFLAPDPSYLRGSRCHSDALFWDGSAESSTLRSARPQ